MHRKSVMALAVGVMAAGLSGMANIVPRAAGEVVAGMREVLSPYTRANTRRTYKHTTTVRKDARAAKKAANIRKARRLKQKSPNRRAARRGAR